MATEGYPEGDGQLSDDALPPDPAADEQSYHQQEQLSTRPCEACGGQLEFHIGEQQLVCPHCGASEEIVHAPDASVDEQSYAALAIRAANGQLLRHEDGEKEIICQNCGGHTTFIGTVTSQRCPYCATPIQRTDVHDAPDRLAVDGVLPFTITDEAASDLLQQWINKRWFAPNEFKKYSSEGSFASVYAAYFTYDAQATTDYRGQRGDVRTRTVGHGENRRTQVYTDWSPASGRVHNAFDDVTILGNTGFEPRYVNELVPWPTAQLQPYNSDYIAGHLCRTYDRTVETCFQDAKDHMVNEIDQTIRRDIGGDHQKISHKHSSWAGLTYKHVLLPIWLLTVIYDGQPWQVFINGATGEVHGERPWSKPKIIATALLVVFIIAVLVLARAATG